MTYPATNSKEASGLLIDVSNQMHEIVNEDATTEVMTESGLVPSVRKALADTFLFQDPIPWQQGSDETAFNQLRTFSDNLYWAPTATTLNPIPMGATPIGDSNWKLAPVDVSREWTLQELTRSQNEVIGGKIFPLDDAVLQNGDDVPVGTTHLRVDIGGEPTIVGLYPINNGVVSLLGDVGATVGGVSVDFYLPHHVNEDSINVRAFFVKGDNLLGDFTKLGRLFNFANATGRKVLGNKGDIYRLDNTTAIDVQVNVDWGGAGLAPTLDGDFFNIIPSNDKQEATIPFAELLLLRNQWEGTIVHGWDNSSPVTNSSFAIVTDEPFCERIGFGFTQSYQECGVILNDGNVIGEKLVGVELGNVTKAIYKPLENEELVFENFHYIIPELQFQPTIRVTRNQVRVKNCRPVRTSNEPVEAAYSGRIFRPVEVYGFTLEDIQSDPTGGGRGGGVASTYGYLVEPQLCTKITYDNVNVVGMWGMSAGDWMKEVTVKDSHINRFDCHFGLGNVTVKNSTLYGWGFAGSFGDGVISLRDVKYAPQRTTQPNGDVDIYDLGAVVTTARSDYGMGYRGSVIVDGIKLIVDPRDENGLGQSEDFAIVQYPPTSGTYNNIESHFHAPKKVIVKNLTVERVSPAVNTTKEFKISAFTMNRQGTQKPYYLPYDVIVDGMDCGDSDNIFFSGYNSQGAWENDNASSQGAQKCKWAFKNINNKEFAWDWDAVPLIADKNARLDENAKVSIVYFGTRFGFTQTAASRADFDITIDNCKGWFYNNRYMGDLKITDSKMISCRTINPADVVGRQPDQVMSNCFVYPFPQDINGGVDWQSTPVEGGLRMHHCSVRSMTMQTYGLVGEIYGNLYYFGDSNLVPIEMRQTDANLLWDARFAYANKYKVPTTP